MDSLTNEMRLSNRKIQCIDVRPIIILNGGKRLIVAFAPELALRSPSLPGIDSSAKRDFCACFLPSIQACISCSSRNFEAGLVTSPYYVSWRMGTHTDSLKRRRLFSLNLGEKVAVPNPLALSR